MINAKGLGVDNIRELRNILAEGSGTDAVLGQAAFFAACSKVGPDKIKELKGFAPFVEPAFVAGQSDKMHEQAYDADPTQGEIQVSERAYRIRRRSHQIPYNKKFSKSEIFDQAKDEIMPAIARTIYTSIDLGHFAPIMKGTGLVKDSRNLSTKDIATTKLNADTTDVLGLFQDAIADTGGDTMFLSPDVALALLRHKQLTGARAGSGEEVLKMGSLVSTLREHLPELNEVLIGRHQFQDGSPRQGLNFKHVFEEVCCVYRKSNIAVLWWDQEDIDFQEYEWEPNNMVYQKGEAWFDIVTYDPAFGRAFKNVL